MSFTRYRRRGRIMKKRTRRTQNKKKQTRKKRMRKRGGNPLNCVFPIDTLKVDDTVGKKGILGEGSFGKTFVVIETIQTGTGEIQTLIETNEKQYVVKENTNSTDNHITSAKKEATILKILSDPPHPNILRYVGCNNPDNENKFYIITEYNPGYVDLISFINQTIPENTFKATQNVAKSFATKMVTQIISGFKQEIIINTCITQLYAGLYAIHSKNVFHRDIKPDNIIINPKTGDIKYIDFGASNAIVDGTLIEDPLLVGSQAYMPYMGSIECNKDPNIFIIQMIFIDYWGLAVTIYALIYKTIYYFKNTTYYKISSKIADPIDTRLDALTINHYIKVSEILFPSGKNHSSKDFSTIVNAFMKKYKMSVREYNANESLHIVKLNLFDEIRNNNWQNVNQLIQNGADVNAKDKYGLTPMHGAVEKGNLEMVKLLIKNGAVVNAKDNDEKTPLFYAVDNKSHDMVTTLIQKGADVNAKDANRNTPLDIATENKLTEIIGLLQNKSTNP